MNYFVLVGINSKNLTCALSRWSLLSLRFESPGYALLSSRDFACTTSEAGAGMDPDEETWRLGANLC